MTGPGMLWCIPYECDLSEPSCALRHRAAVDGNLAARTRMAHCIGCDVGADNARKHGKMARAKGLSQWPSSSRA